MREVMQRTCRTATGNIYMLTPNRGSRGAGHAGLWEGMTWETWHRNPSTGHCNGTPLNEAHQLLQSPHLCGQHPPWFW